MITRPLLQKIRPELTAALADVAERHGISINVGSCTFDASGSNARFKLELATLDEGGRARTPAVTDFETYARAYDLEPSDLGRSFSAHGEVYTIEGLKPRSTKYPILGKSTNGGKTFKFPATTVKAGLHPKED